MYYTSIPQVKNVIAAILRERITVTRVGIIATIRIITEAKTTESWIIMVIRNIIGRTYCIDKQASSDILGI